MKTDLDYVKETLHVLAPEMSDAEIEKFYRADPTLYGMIYGPVIGPQTVKLFRRHQLAEQIMSKARRS